MGTGCKIQENPWKNKAIERAKEIKELVKELIRQKLRAERWRNESSALKKTVLEQALEIEAKNLKIKELEANSGSPFYEIALKDVHLKGYKYALSVIWLCVNLYKSGLSLRQVCIVLEFTRSFLGVKFKVPSYGAVRIWVRKTGLHLLEKGGKTGKKSKSVIERWCLIVDESYSLGKSQLLLVLAVRLSDLQQGRALRVSDVVPAVIRSRESWKGEDVSQVLTEASKKIGGRVEYVVSDRGAGLMKAFQIQGLPHVCDWSHFSANVLEKLYVNNIDFKLFNEKMGNFKKKRKQGQHTRCSPPTLSVKMRFLNYTPFLEWADAMLLNFKKIPAQIAPELQFLKDLKPFIGEMTDLFFTAHKIGVILKKEGINPTSQAKALGMLEILEQNIKDNNKKYPNPSTVTTFTLEVKQYFNSAISIYHKVTPPTPENVLFAPSFDGLVASSDIIESIFGKLKSRCLKDPKRGFSAISLIIPLFCHSFSPFHVFEALAKVSMNDLEKWKKNNIANNINTSWRNAFKSKSKNGEGFKLEV